ncbi:hypothetical protein FBU31_000471 [Coemansia sp. 'formosensis']|nr:hypothetical protein FBU31_000471 [Coemansia sp. 'formosensis']
MFMDMSAYNNSQYDAPGYYVPSLQQRFFASRPLELLPIHREVIHTNQSESAGPSTSISHKKPEYAMPWWPTTVDATTSAADPTQLLLQPCLPWPLLTMSPAFSGDSALPELMPQSSPQTIYSASAFSAEALALMSLPSSPPPSMLSNMAAVPTSLDDDQLFARIAECRANGMTWQDMSEVFSAQMGGSGLSATQLSYLYFRRNPEPLSAATTTHRFVPYTIKKSATAAVRAQADRQAEAKLAYLNVDQFKQLQRLVSEYGESWDLISSIMGVRAGDLQKNWRGYSPRTIITRPWTRGEIEILSLCRAIGVCCRTTAKLIGTKLPLQCRRKTVKPADCLPSTSVHCPPNGPMYLVTAQKHQPSSSLAISRAFGLQQDCQAAQIEVDKGSLAVAREIVRLHASSVHEPGAGVRHMLELAHEAMPGYSQRTVDMCMLAILGSHPDYESGQQPPRSLLTAPPPYVKATPVEPPSPPSPLSPVVEIKDETTVVNDLHKWSSHEIAALKEYVEGNQGKKSWKTLALLLGTKTAAQCCNKYRSMRRYHKL